MGATEPGAFGLLLRQHRTQAGLTQEELAERANLSARVVSDLERGVTQMPQRHTVRQLAAALDLSAEERATFEAHARQRSLPAHRREEAAGGWRSSTRVQTFLIADIRGYTRFTQEHGDEAGARLAERFATVAREVVSSRGGEVLELRGDEALAMFESPRHALRAALALQDRLQQEAEIHPDLPLQAGIGIDAGEAVPVQGGYRTGALNLAARLCSIAAPGDVFASETVVGLARGIEGLVYLDRGQVQLKGFPDPVRVIQVVAEGAVPSHLPKFTVHVTPTTNLPIQTTPFIGRQQELASVTGILLRDDVRLLTLAGPGGTGKTRLALQAANGILTHFPDGAFFVSLAPLADPALVASAIAATLEVKEVVGQPLVDTLTAYLRDKQLLLVLDNFEHLLDACPLVGELLVSCPRLKVLVTSRSVLHLTAEHLYVVPPLAVPDPRHLPELGALSQYDAVALFIERASATAGVFTVTNENAPAVVEICSRLDGLPLAIELAAARVRVFPPQALLKRLESRLALLTAGARDAPARLQTLRSTIDWSYNLLTPEEQKLFARLSVFAGGCTLEAAEAVGSEGDLAGTVFDGLASLVEKSLLRREGEVEPRFVMLDTIREYAAERLESSGTAEEIRRRHAEFFLALAEKAEEHVGGPEQDAWLERLETEQNNLRAALAWSLAQPNPELGLRLAASSQWGFRLYYPTEARRWLEEAVGKDALAAPDLRAKLRFQAARIAWEQAEYERSATLAEQSLTLYRAAGDKRGAGGALAALGNVALVQSDYAHAQAFYEESRSLASEALDPHGVAYATMCLGFVVEARGEYARARALAEKSLALYRELGDDIWASYSLSGLGQAALAQGDYEEAATLLEEALAQARKLGFKGNLGATLNTLGRVELERGNHDRARALETECLELAREVEDQLNVVNALVDLAEIAAEQDGHHQATALLSQALAISWKIGTPFQTAAALEVGALISTVQGQWERAAVLWGGAAALRGAIGAPPTMGQQARNERYGQLARAHVDETAWAVAWEKGRSMTVDRVVAYALQRAPTSVEAVARPRSRD